LTRLKETSLNTENNNWTNIPTDTPAYNYFIISV